MDLSIFIEPAQSASLKTSTSLAPFFKNNSLPSDSLSYLRFYKQLPTNIWYLLSSLVFPYLSALPTSIRMLLSLHPSMPISLRRLSMYFHCLLTPFFNLAISIYEIPHLSKCFTLNFMAIVSFNHSISFRLCPFMIIWSPYTIKIVFLLFQVSEKYCMIWLSLLIPCFFITFAKLLNHYLKP